MQDIAKLTRDLHHVYGPDIAQEALCQVLELQKTGRDIRDFGGYCFSVAKSIAVRQGRAQKTYSLDVVLEKVEHGGFVPDSLLDSTSNPEEQIIETERESAYQALREVYQARLAPLVAASSRKYQRDCYRRARRAWEDN